jgi:hypothetical protein
VKIDLPLEASLCYILRDHQHSPKDQESKDDSELRPVIHHEAHGFETTILKIVIDSMITNEGVLPQVEQIEEPLLEQGHI